MISVLQLFVDCITLGLCILIRKINHKQRYSCLTLFLNTMSGKVYEKRIQLETCSPLLLVTAFEADAFPTVELAMTYDNEWDKENVKVPCMIWRMWNRYFTDCFHELMEVARNLILDGAEWFELFHDTLCGYARSAWDLMSEEVLVEANRTENAFRDTFRFFVASLVDETAHRIFLDYLRSTLL